MKDGECVILKNELLLILSGSVSQCTAHGCSVCNNISWLCEHVQHMYVLSVTTQAGCVRDTCIILRTQAGCLSVYSTWTPVLS